MLVLTGIHVTQESERSESPIFVIEINNMAVFDKEWQKTKASITERGIFMFNNILLSDVSLVVGSSSDEGEPKKSKMAIPAHKFVLSSCSPVFFAMFCGELAEKSESVDLPDCEYEGCWKCFDTCTAGKRN